jgi:hypothetical protein
MRGLIHIPNSTDTGEGLNAQGTDRSMLNGCLLYGIEDHL